MSESQSQVPASNGESSSSSGPSQANANTGSQPACSKISTDEKPLKPCTKCQSVQYCSKECQKADFKNHKKECAKKAQIYAQTADIKLAAPNRAPKDGFRGGLQKWQFDT
ncbi:hypothetical protein BKA61DRAFT_572707 [Leptodontidium sp. MPI-SDFR-AT-0119]|nr:hypothetical protein BKA61DRAFT_572707 [Leptodontidium sp. MPI-SDFR-AT-0119]